MTARERRKNDAWEKLDAAYCMANNTLIEYRSLLAIAHSPQTASVTKLIQSFRNTYANALKDKSEGKEITS